MTATARRRPLRPVAREGGESGFILVAVLWILMALAALAGSYALYAGNSAVAARVSTGRLQTDALISAGIELTALQLIGRSEEDLRSVGELQFRMGGAEVAARFRSEGARIDLNAAPKELLAGLFTTLGAKPEAAAYYAERIIGWRKKNEGPQNKEANAYKDAGLKYPPRQSPFENVAELRFVLGIPPGLVEHAMPFVTIFNGSPQIDVIAAPPEVIASLPHIEPDSVHAVLDRRERQDLKSILPLLGGARSSVLTEPRKTARVNIIIAFEGGRRVEAEAVILLVDKASDPYRILAWRDDFDGSF